MRKLIFVNILAFFMLQTVFGQISPVEEMKYSPNGYFETVFDHYGNSYQLKDLLAGAEVKVENTTYKSTLSVCNSGIFELYFEDNWFGNSATTAQQEARKEVICQVFHDLSDFIVTPLKDVGNTTKVKIWVRKINNLPFVPSNVLGLATSFYTMPYNSAANFGGIIDNEVWKTITLGSDSFINVASPLVNTNGLPISSGNFYHGMMAFDFNNFIWNTDLSNNSPIGQYDLYTVVLHEVTHALGFASLMDENGQSRFGTGYNYFSRYDALLRNHAETQKLITNSGACSTMYNYSFNGALNISILHPNATNCNTDQTTCSTAIKFFGPTNTSPVYTPNCFESGSSLSHFEDQCIGQVNNSYFVMSNVQSNGLSPNTIVNTKRFLKAEERNALSDIGYRLNTTYGNNLTAFNSFINYGGSTTSGNIVAGTNDGINPTSGFFTFIGNVGTTINLTNILYNDKNAVSFECLQDIFDASATISVTSGSNTTPITFLSSVEGLHLLRYVPISASGKRGNICYVYIYLSTLDNCGNGGAMATACDLVINGDFEINSGIPSTVTEFYKVCKWKSVGTNYPSNDYLHKDFIQIGNNYNVSIPCNIFGYQDVNNNAGRGYGGIAIRRDESYIPNNNRTEIIKTKLSTPLQPNTTYRLKFDVSLADGASSNAIKFQAYFSNIEISTPGNVPFLASQINDQMLKENSTFSEVFNGWEEIQFIFTTSSVSGEQYMYLGGISDIQFKNITPASQVPGCNYENLNIPPFSQIGDTYYFIDNVSLIPISGIFDLPNEICNNSSINDLSNYLLAFPNNGVFSGDGVINTSGVYSFNALLAGMGSHRITYSFTNSSGCLVTISDIILVTSEITTTFNPIEPVCFGSSINPLSNTSNEGITGTWSPAFNNMADETYTFTPSTGYCATTVTMTITVLPANDPSCNSNPCPPDLTLSTPEINPTIVYKTENWIKANSNYEVDGENVTMKAGDYIVFETDAHLKAGSEVTALIEVCTATSKMSTTKAIEKTIFEEKTLNESIVLFPNPSTDRLTIASDNITMNSVVITAMDGKIIYSNQTVNTSKLELDTSSYQGGIYMVSITTTNGTGFVKKLVKN